jgi:hypothetical protein
MITAINGTMYLKFIEEHLFVRPVVAGTAGTTAAGF